MDTAMIVAHRASVRNVSAASWSFARLEILRVCSCATCVCRLGRLVFHFREHESKCVLGMDALGFPGARLQIQVLTAAVTAAAETRHRADCRCSTFVGVI